MKVFYFWIPEEMNLDMILQNYPYHEIAGFHKDKLLYIVHTICSRAALNKDDVTEDGFIPLNAVLLKDWLGIHYREYLKCLRTLGVIASNGTYIVGTRSTGYRLTNRAINDLKGIPVTDGTLLKKFHDWHVKTDLSYTGASVNQVAIQSQQNVYQLVSRWYNTRTISIDVEAAKAYNRQARDYKKAGRGTERWDFELQADGSYRYKDPDTQHIAGLQSIERISDGLYSLSVDKNVYRMHSVLTNCKKELRNYIRIAGQQGTAVDLSNSQPSLLLCLLDEAFWDGTGAFNQNQIPYFKQDIFKSNNHLQDYIKLLKKMKHNGVWQSEVQEFIDLVSSGTFYESLRTSFKDKLGLDYPSRDAVKPAIFTVLFTSNRFIGQTEAAPKRAFRDLFPTIFEATKMLKKKDYTTLPVLLQQIESYIMYHRIVPRIAQERPDLPILPIHDSIATISGAEGYVEQVMREEIARCIGVEPHFKHEVWTPQPHPGQLALGIQQLLFAA